MIEEKVSLEKVKAKNIFDYRRLDLVVKYLYAKEILEKPYNDYCTDCYKDLYIRHILMRTMGVEPVDVFGKPCEKVNIDDYINSFKNLIESIKNNGFDENCPVPFCDGLIANGAHRIAAAAALDKDVYIKHVDIGYSWDFNWFCDFGFNTEDKQRILKGFVDLNYDNCAIFVVWNPLFSYIDNVKTIINEYFDIVGDVELDFEDNCIAFTNALLDIYEPNISKCGDDTTILEKSKLLQANHLSFKVIVATNQHKNCEKDLSKLSQDCKKNIRELFDHLLPKECFCTVHSSDGKDECKYLSDVLLSPNNIKYLKMRYDYIPGHNFVRRIRNLPSFLKTMEILTPDDICVIGSGVMTALGIQKDSDSDFITDYKYRDKLGWNTVYLNDDYDIGASDKVANRPKNISDNILIHNSEYHFLFKGIKFANLDMIKDRKSFNPRPKDIIHLRQIELYEKLIGHRNQQKMLMDRIESEKQRRLALENPAPINRKVQYSNAFERIFSIKNEIANNKKFKVVTIAGLKIKIRRGKNNDKNR